MKKRLAVSTLVVLVLLVAVVPVFAGYTWCSTDPAIKLPDNQGTMHIQVSIPVEYRDTGLTLYLIAPVGSQVTSSDEWVNVVFVPRGRANRVIAAVNAGFPVELSAELNGQALGSQLFENGRGAIVWRW